MIIKHSLISVLTKNIKIFFFVLICFLLQACEVSDQERIQEIQKLFPDSYVSTDKNHYFIVITPECLVYGISFWPGSTTKMDIIKYK